MMQGSAFDYMSNPYAEPSRSNHITRERVHNVTRSREYDDQPHAQQNPRQQLQQQQQRQRQHRQQEQHQRQQRQPPSSHQQLQLEQLQEERQHQLREVERLQEERQRQQHKLDRLQGQQQQQQQRGVTTTTTDRGPRQISISRSDSSESGKPRMVREISDHQREIRDLETGSPQQGVTNSGRRPGEKKFLKKVQHELEEQRQEWKGEVDRLTNGSMMRGVPKNAKQEGDNSFVDNSSGVPIFKAFFDVSEYSPRNISVNVDKLTCKCIVQCRKAEGHGTLTRTFTHKIQLPRFADDERLSCHVSRDGVLRVEVPLIYYFPLEKKSPGRDIKSFVYEIRKNDDGSQTLEILVNTGPGVSAKDLHVQVTDENVLLVTAEGVDEQGKPTVKLIKKYSLPEMADVDHTRSRLGKDGRLVILVPMKKH